MNIDLHRQYLAVKLMYEDVHKRNSDLHAKLEALEEQIIESQLAEGVTSVRVDDVLFSLSQRWSVKCPYGNCREAAAELIKLGRDDCITVNHQRASAYAREGFDFGDALIVEQQPTLSVRK